MDGWMDHRVCRRPQAFTRVWVNVPETGPLTLVKPTRRPLVEISYAGETFCGLIEPSREIPCSKRKSPAPGSESWGTAAW